MERRALMLIAALLILLVIYQLLLLLPDMKKNMTSIDRLEGTPIQMQTVHEQYH
jgi:competence protein ComGC